MIDNITWTVNEKLFKVSDVNEIHKRGFYYNLFKYLR